MEILRIKKDASTIGWLLLLGQVLIQGAAMVVIFIGMLLHLSGTMMIASDIGSFLANFVMMGIFWLIKRKELPSIETKCSQNPLKLTLLTIAPVMLLNETVSLFDYLTGGRLSIPIGEMTDSNPLWLNLLLIAVFPAIVEEFAFRKVIFGTMRPYGFGTAALFSSLMFGLMHQNFIQLIFAFAMGMVLCLLYERTGNLIWCSLVHFANNAYAVLLSAAPISEQTGYLIELGLGLAGLIVTAVLLLRRNIRPRRLLQIESDAEKQWFAANIRSAMTSVSVIIYTVLCLLMCVMVIIVL